jgi:hypothetical protein
LTRHPCGEASWDQAYISNVEFILATIGFSHPVKRRTVMPQQAWTDKQERQYRHIKEGEVERGRSEDRAEEIAARTVNKHRREIGQTENRTTQGTGNPNRSLEERTKQELYNRAKELDIDGRSRMTKQQLIQAIRNRQ